jgi:hypothetical protein
MANDPKDIDTTDDHDNRGLLQGLVGDGRPLLLLVGVSLALSGGFAIFLAATGHFLPHDEKFLGMTAAQLCSLHGCRIVHFMYHDRGSFGGSIIAIGTLYLWLAEFPLRQGRPWAWWTFLLSGTLGFASFLTYLGYGYLDTWHGVATIFLLPCYVWGMIRTFALLRGPRTPGAMLEPGERVAWSSRFGAGRLCLMLTAATLVAGGLVIMTVGMTTVFVPQDLKFMGLSPADLQAINPRLVPLIAHDRAGFGGGLCATGLTVFLCVWCGTPSRNLWQTIAVAGAVGFGTAIGVHPLIGYLDFTHLAPAVVAAIIFAVGLVLTYPRMMRGGREAPIPAARLTAALSLCFGLTLTTNARAAESPASAPVDATTLHHKVLCGYQGWFRCPGDPANEGWVHWSRRGDRIAPDTLTFEMWPDMREYGWDERYAASGFTHPDGTQASLFSSANPNTVERHFKWMRQYGLEGVFLQRFLVNIGNPSLDRVLDNVRASAKSTGRTYAIFYDMTAYPPDKTYETLVADWKRLVDEKRITKDDRYLHDNGKPVLVVWGFFEDRFGPELANRIIDFFKNDPKYGVTLIGGVQWNWRTAAKDPEWAKVFRRFDIISPWNVGNVMRENGKRYASTAYWKADIAEAAKHGERWMPVIYPGFGWTNLKGKGAPGPTIPRLGGEFFGGSSSPLRS